MFLFASRQKEKNGTFMITFKKFGTHGNLGNQLHQLASLIGFSEKYNCELVLPPWKYAEYFNYKIKTGIIETDFFLQEPYYHYTPELWDEYRDNFKTQNVDILGWLQSEKYWQHCKQKVFDTLTFKEDIIEKLKTRFADVLKKKTIAISIRRGDFITDPNHYLLPIHFYLNALLKIFPDYKACNVVFFSDDLKYCETQIKSHSNFYFATGLNAIEQLCLMSLCENFIISNSTFSWWGAMLGEKQDSKIIRSPYYVSGDLKETLDYKDYYPERWLSYDNVGDKINLRAVKKTGLSHLVHKTKVKGKAAINAIYERL